MESLDRLTVGGLIEAVAARTPAPGGGAVAAVTAALAAALGRMVAGYAAGGTGLGESGRVLRELSEYALRLAGEDARAFARLSSLWKLPQDHPERRAGWDEAVDAAIDAPWRVLETALRVLEVLERGAPGSTRLRSDVAISAILAEAAARAAAWNVRINLELLPDRARAKNLEERTARALERAAEACRAVERSCEPGGRA